MFRTFTAVCLVLTGLAMADIDRTREQCTVWEDDCAGQRVVQGRSCPCIRTVTRSFGTTPAVSYEAPVAGAAIRAAAGARDEREDGRQQHVATPWPPSLGSTAADTLAAPGDTLAPQGAATSAMMWLGFVLP